MAHSVSMPSIMDRLYLILLGKFVPEETTTESLQWIIDQVIDAERKRISVCDGRVHRVFSPSAQLLGPDDASTPWTANRVTVRYNRDRIVMSVDIE